MTGRDWQSDGQPMNRLRCMTCGLAFAGRTGRRECAVCAFADPGEPPDVDELLDNEFGERCVGDEW